MLKFTKGGKIVMTESDNGDLKLTEDAGEWGNKFVEGGDPSGPVTNPWAYATADKLMKAVVASPGDGMALDAYLVAMGGWRQSPKTKLKYPHHTVGKEGSLAVHKDGLAKAARSVMKKEPNNVDAIDHAKKHFGEMGMSWKEEVEDKLHLQEDYED